MGSQFAPVLCSAVALQREWNYHLSFSPFTWDRSLHHRYVDNQDLLGLTQSWLPDLFTTKKSQDLKSFLGRLFQCRSIDHFGLHPQCGFWIYFGICTCSRCHYWYQCIIFYGGFCRNCLFLASNRYRWFLQSSWTWSYFVGHTVRCIHLCFSVWTRIRYCYAITCCSFGTDASCFFKDLGEKRRNNIWLLLCVIFLAWCIICWIIRISRSGAKYFDNVGVPVWDPSLHPFYALQLHFNENGTSQCHFLHLLGIVLYIIDTLTIVFCWFLTIVESYHMFRFLEFTILFCSHFVGSGCWTGGIRFPPWYVATDYHFGITLKQTFTIYAKC